MSAAATRGPTLDAFSSAFARHPRLGAELGEVAERLRMRTVQVSSGPGAGAGVVWTEDGSIVTNAHVARGSRVRVTLADGRQLDGDVVRRDASRDLALVRVQARGLETATPGDPSTLRPGALVVAVGNPWGIVGALSVGVVHAMERDETRSIVRADVRLAPGNSGGPLADASGRVVGINSMIVNGLGIAVSSSTVARFLREGERARLGVRVRPVTVRRSVRGTSESELTGLLVLEVDRGGPAAEGSVFPGDVIVGLNGRPLSSAAELADLLDGSPGVPAALEVVRGGQRTVRTVTPLARSSWAPSSRVA